jgi:hypothetical protein
LEISFDSLSSTYKNPFPSDVMEIAFLNPVNSFFLKKEESGLENNKLNIKSKYIFEYLAAVNYFTTILKIVKNS